VETDRGVIALKSYPQPSENGRKRLDVEWKALSFLRAHGIWNVPAPIARDHSGAFMTMEWIEGDAVTAPNDDDIAAACDFVARVFRLSSDDEAATFPLASEACLSLREIVRQIECRLRDFSYNLLLREFLNGTFRQALDAALARMPHDPQERDLEQTRRRLIPADFGFHNALRVGDGTLRFVDFEYFGWDDPVKLTADMLLHPGVPLSVPQQRLVCERLANLVPDDFDFLARLRRTYRVFALRWALILLNPFRIDRASTLPAGAEAHDILLATQLDKAHAMLERGTFDSISA
jgi:hypothetical protein